MRRRLPLYVWASLGLMLSVQMLVFYGTRLALPYLTLRDLSVPLDAQIPFIPAWVTVYFSCFVLWLVNALWILSESRAHAFRFACAYLIALAISAACFLLLPCTMERPAVTGDGLFAAWMRFLYRADTPTNLCPSLHVVVTYFCWRGTMGCTKIPRWYRWFSFAALILVCLSILFVKQHVLIDIPAAIAVSELSLQLARSLRAERLLFALSRRIKHR